MSDANFTLDARVSPTFLIIIIIIIIIIIYIVLFSYSALYNYYVNVEPTR